jgi:hypothetical protein
MTDRTSVEETGLNPLPRCIPVMIAVPAVAIMIAGCTDSRIAATDRSIGAQVSGENNQERRPADYQTGYGISSNGPTTDVYTELFRSNARDDRNAPAPVSSGAVPQDQPAPASPGAVPQGQPAPASSVAQQEPAKPQAPPASPTAYGIPNNGMTTDLYTELFGPRSHE